MLLEVLCVVVHDDAAFKVSAEQFEVFDEHVVLWGRVLAVQTVGDGVRFVYLVEDPVSVLRVRVLLTSFKAAVNITTS